MWTVEVNVLGRRFTHTIGDRPDALRLSPRLSQWRQRRTRHPRAAA
jgi:hypothetical protein